MYDFHYNFLKKDFDTELLYTDTDSLAYEIKSEDVLEEFFKHKHLFDLSNYPKDSKVFDPVNEKVIGKMKDVSDGKINNEFVGLKSKMVKNIIQQKEWISQQILMNSKTPYLIKN